MSEHVNDKVYRLLDTVRQGAVQAGAVAGAAAYGAGKRAEELWDSARIRLRAMDLEDRIHEQLEAVGRLMYATHTGRSTDSERMLAKLREIDGWKAELDALNVRLGRKGLRYACMDCGAAAREGDRFCRKCGSRL